MANQPPAPSPMKSKRPLWMTALILVAAVAVWFAQQKGWIRREAGQSSSTPAARNTATKPEPSQRPQTSAAAPLAKPAPKAAADEDADESDSSLTAAERAAKPPVKTSDIDDLFAKKRDGVWVEGPLKFKKALPDDDDPPRHQRFLADTPDGHSVMVAHNIDLSDRVPVQPGDSIEVRGEYVWTEQGGKVHFTHKPQYGKFSGGWVKAGGKKYE